MANYFNYFTEIEEHFVRRRGKNLLVSPLDWCLIELWKENGIPLHIVLRGIDRSFESSAKRAKSPPRTLFYCHPAILESFEEYRESRRGLSSQESGPQEGESSAGEPERASVIRFLEKLQKRVGRLNLEELERVEERLAALAKEVRQRRDLRLPMIDRDLEEVGSLLVEILKEKVPSESAGALEKEAGKELKAYKKRLSSEMFEKLKQNYLKKKIREHFGLPDFSLLGDTLE